LCRVRAKNIEGILTTREAVLKRTRRLLLQHLSRLQVEEIALEERLVSIRQAKFASAADNL